MISQTLSGARIKIFINGKEYGQAVALSWTADYSETEIYGIDSIFPQEISPVRVSTQGQIQGLRLGGSGGLQRKGITSTINEIVRSGYINIRVTDRRTGEDIMYAPKVRISNEQHSVSAKGGYRLSFSFKGIAALQPLDRQ